MPRQPTAKAVYWLLTIPHNDFTPFLHSGVQYIRGQLELGSDTGYLHWQILVVLKSQQRLSAIKTLYGTSCHAEPSRSEAADDYVWKDEQDLNLDLESLNETTLLIGPLSEIQLVEGSWILCRQMCMCDIIGPSKQLPSTIANLVRSNERFMCTGDELELESLVGPGMKQDWKASLKILGLNFGMVTDLIAMLLSMNFEETSIYLTSSDGLTDTLSSWKSKGLLWF
jgi:hypothetical protein